MGCCNFSMVNADKAELTFRRADDPAGLERRVDRTHMRREPGGRHDLVAGVTCEWPADAVARDALAARIEALREAVAHRGNAIWVGAIRQRPESGDGFRETQIFYLDNRFAFETALRGVFEAETQLDVAFESDADWAYYREQLLPTPLEAELATNAEVRGAMTAAGENLSRARLIRHLVTFAGPGAMHAMAQRMGGEGFAVGYLSESPEDDGRYWLGLERWDKPAEIDAVTTIVLEQAIDHGARYEGWGCMAVGKSYVVRAAEALAGVFAKRRQ